MNREDILRDLKSRAITPAEAKARLASLNVPGDLDDRIAIVGMSGRYPGAGSLDAYWTLLAEGRTAVREVPASRWDVDAYYDPRPQQPGKVYCKWLGALDEVEYFDPLFFGISPAEASAMDPQHRLFLQESYHAFEDAGYAPAMLDGKRCGVYLGIMGNEYVGLCQRAGAGSGEATGNSSSIAAARIAYHLNLKGPAIAVDTACSSSLVATHLACQALLAGETDMALAGGVTLYLTAQTHISMCEAGMLSASGRVSAFDDAADGFVPGEGVGVLVLKRLRDAIADEDRIHAVILGSGINQDGRTNGITAPSVSSQIELLRGVYRRYRIDPASIGYVEAHGTGTRLGDPIEFEALSAAFRDATSHAGFCALGSVKGNIGHTSAAAGVAGMHKVVLSMREKHLVPTLNYQRPNEHCELSGSPFVVNTQLRAWPSDPGVPRRAAVSSFGYSGTNAHVVVEEWIGTASGPTDVAGPQLFVLSARGTDELRQQCRDLARYLVEVPATSLSDVAFTLQTGRGAFAHRMAFVAATRREASAKLEGYLAGDLPDGVFAGRVTVAPRHPREDGTMDTDDLTDMAKRWVAGAEPQWQALPRSASARRAHLPTYPFAKERCWVDDGHILPVAPPPSLVDSAPREQPAFDTLELLLPDTAIEPLPPMPSTPPTARTVMVGGTAAQAADAARAWPTLSALPLPNVAAIGDWARELGGLGRIDHVLWIAPDDGEAVPGDPFSYEAQSEPVVACFHAIRALLAIGYGERPLQWTLVTRGMSHHPAHAALLGLLASVVKEHPDWSLRPVDIEGRGEPTFEQIARVPCETLGRGWIHRSGQWLREYLRPVPVPSRVSGAFRQHGVYVIVGGAGGVGEVFTEHLMREYQARVVWVGRRPREGVPADKLARLAAFGAAPLYLQADATDPAALAAVRARVLEVHGEIHGVIHSAIELHDQTVAGMDAVGFERTFAIKAQVATHILQVFLDVAIDGVMLFSSLASYSREAGQSNYSAGSLYQDALVRHLATRHGRRVKTINWGFWGDIGATATLDARVRSRFAQVGIGALEPAEAMAALEIFMHAALPQLAALHRSTPETAQVSDAAHAPIATPDPEPVINETVAVIDIEAHVKTTLLAQLAATLKLSPERIEHDNAFAEYGVDSISSVRIVRALNEALGIELAGTSLFDHSSVNKLVRHVMEEHATSRLSIVPAPEAMPPASEAAPSAPAAAPAPAAGPGPIAIVGMSGRFPGSADLDELWTHLAGGHEVTGPITRWKVETSVLPESTRVCPRGGFLSDIDQFDPLFFNISGTEATYMDPQHRLLLETSWHALENAGYAGEAVAGSRCGVYMGFNGGDYGHLLHEQPSLPPHAMWGNAASVLSARIAYYLDLQGPAITLDTACSSSLVAVHLACQGLWTGETDVALAGGVWIQCTPGFLVSSSRAGMLSPTGQCRAFSAGADGFVPSEGVGVVVLKRLQDALDAGDHIHGVIRGSAINQDGASNGITAPSAAAQERLQRHVYDTFGVNPDHLQMVEAHGTGTVLGDPIEASALTRSFRQYTDRKQFCALGSIKTNIGHAGAAAGVAGLIKVLLALRHLQIPPSLHFVEANPHIAFADSPFFVNTRLREWSAPTDRRRLGAVSSFGLSGTNAHVVVEEAPATGSGSSVAEPALLLISGFREADLPAQVEALADYLEREAVVDLPAVGFTLAMGRRHHRYRLALVARTATDAVAQLRGWLSQQPSRVTTGTTASAVDADGALRAARCMQALAHETDPASREQMLAELAGPYLRGTRLQLADAFRTRRRVPLPVYRFARKRYWVPERGQEVDAETLPAQVASTAPAVAPASVATPLPLHPFVHALQATSGSEAGARFTTHWTGDEFFLRDHVVQGVPMLPGAACLELARAAARLSHPDRQVCQLRNVAWLRPLAVAAPVDLRIALDGEQGEELSFRVTGPGADAPYCQGRITLGHASPAPVIDVATIRSRCDQRELAAADFYRVFDLMGLSYGESYRGIERAFVGKDQLLAQIRLPTPLAATLSQFHLHPSLLDSALQASIGFEIGAVGEDGAQGESRSPMLFALERMELFGHGSERMWVWIRRDVDRPGNKLDVDLCDQTGRVVARLSGVTSRVAAAPARTPAASIPARPAPVVVDRQPDRRPEAVPTSADAATVGTLTLAPAWEPTPSPGGEPWPEQRAAVVVVGGDDEQFAQVRKHYPRARHLPAAIGDTVDRAAEELRGAGTLEHIIWLVPAPGFRSIDSESIVIEQQRGVLAIFRLVKALIKLDYAKKPLGLTVITVGTQPVFEREEIDPTHAGVHGLVGTLAKEYPSWSVRLVDLQADAPWPLRELLTLPADSDGNAWARRFDRWYRLRWVPCALPQPEQTAFRQGGVYVLIGGAGGIGEAFSEYLIRRYAAQVVWIGLRKRDEVIEEKIERLSRLGPAPHYIATDATDQPSMERASMQIEARFGSIHGVVHAALLMAGDPLERMDEQRFWRGLAAKIEVSLRMVQAFAHLPLDFVLFFSSIQALERTQRQANYAAGCTVEDAFAARLARDWACSVRVVNWGYWGSVGFAAISSGYRNWIAQAGMGSVEPEEGMAALERLLAGPHRQLAFLKTQRSDALKGVRFSDDRLSRVQDTAPIVPLDAAVDTEVGHLAADGLPERFEALMLELLCHELDALGVFAETPDRGADSVVVAPYHAWLRHTLNLLAEHKLIVARAGGWRPVAAASASGPWEEWERRSAEWLAKPELAAPVRLADATLRELLQVLGGKRPATDVLFPKSSAHLVEGIYRDSPVPDFFNRALSAVVTRYIERRRRIDPDVRLRILEIGAGTGGTTTPLVEALQPYAGSIADYRFTDISKGFVVAAEGDFGARAPYMSYGTFDVERRLDTQGIDAGSFDIVIAANVLHATSDIHRTLRNTKAALKRNGLLVVNEVCDTSLFAHVTFGLLKGWWLYEDGHLRIPGSPALAPESWRSILGEQGFHAIDLPVARARSLGQQIVVALSDGWVQQAIGAAIAVERAPVTHAAVKTPVVVQPAAPEDGRFADVMAIRRGVRATLAGVLGVQELFLRDDAPLTEYGLDSMLAVQAVEILNTSMDVDLTTTSLFDYPTIDAIVDHIRPSGTSRVTQPSLPSTSLPSSTPVASLPSDGATPAIVETLSTIAGIDSDDIRGDIPFVDYGVDSMLAVQIVEVLNQRLGVDLTTTALFDHPTIDALVAHLSPGTVDERIAKTPVRSEGTVVASTLRARVLKELCEVLEIDASDIEPSAPFTDYGLDSMLAVQWVERLNQGLRLELTTTSPFDYPTMDDLMAHIGQQNEEGIARGTAQPSLDAPPAVATKRQAQPMSYTI